MKSVKQTSYRGELLSKLRTVSKRIEQQSAKVFPEITRPIDESFMEDHAELLALKEQEVRINQRLRYLSFKTGIRDINVTYAQMR